MPEASTSQAGQTSQVGGPAGPAAKPAASVKAAPIPPGAKPGAAKTPVPEPKLSDRGRRLAARPEVMPGVAADLGPEDYKDIGPESGAPQPTTEEQAGEIAVSGKGRAEALAGGEAPDGTAGGTVEEQADTEAGAESTESGAWWQSPDFTNSDGEPFESEQQAVHSFRTLRGMYKSAQEARQRAVAEQQKAAQRAWEMHVELQKLRGRSPDDTSTTSTTSTASTASAGDTIGASTGAPSAKLSAKPSAATAVRKKLSDFLYDEKGPDGKVAQAGIDWQAFEDIHKAQGPVVAHAWLQEQILDVVDEAIEQRIRDHVAPFSQDRELQQRVGRAEQLFLAAREAAGPDGKPLYPELYDDEAAIMVANIWAQLGMAPEHQHSPRSVHLAVLAYRNQFGAPANGNGNGNAAGANRPPVSPEVAAAAAEAVASLDAAAASGAAAVPASPATIRRASNPAEEYREQIKRSIRESSREVAPGITY
jgi:hypothetical protein